MALRFARILPTLLWMLGIFALSSQSKFPQAPGISTELLAIAGHLVAYAVLAVLIARAIGFDHGAITRRPAIAWALAAVYGVSDEIHQSFVPGRFASVEDIVTNAIGAAAGLACMYVIARWHRERASV